MMKKRNYCLGDTVSSFLAALIDKSLCYVERCGFARMNLLCDEIGNNILFDHGTGFRRRAS